MTVRTVTVAVTAQMSGLVAGMTAGVNAVKTFNNELTVLGQQHKDKFNQVALAAGALGLTLTGVFGAIVKSATEFDKEMSAVSSVSDTTGKSLADLREAALEAGKATVYSATQAAQAEEELAKAGISTSDILGGALTGSLALAAAGSLDLADAATIAAQAMNIFHLSGQSVGHIADVLAAGANKSAADVEQLGASLKQGGLVAAQTGLSLEQTVGVLSAFADRGLVASDAGTSLKTMLQALQAPSMKTADLMKQLGLQVYDAQGKFVGIAQLADNLRKTLGPLTQAQRDYAMAQIFGTDATRAASILYNLGAQGVQDYTAAVNDNGAATRAASQRLNNLSGDVEQLRGSFETLTIKSGSGVNTALRGVTEAANGLLGVFIDLPPWVQTTGTVLLGVSGAGLLAATGFLKAKQQAQEFLTTIAGMGPAGEKVAGVLGGLGKAAGVLGLVGTAGFLGVEGIKALVDLWSRSMQPLHRDVDQLTDSLAKFADTQRLTGELAKVTGGDLDQWAKHIADINSQEWWAVQLRNADREKELAKSFKQTTEDTKALDSAMSKLVQNGDAQQANVAFDQLSESLKAAGYSQDAINQMFPEYIDAAGKAAAANRPLAQGFGDVGANANTMARGLQDAIDHGESLLDVFKQLNGAALTMLDTEIAVKQDLADLADKFQKGKGAIDDNTQAGRDNLKMIAQVIDDASKAAQAKYNETGSVGQATDAYHQYIAKLHDALIQAGLTESQVQNLINTYAQMPPAVTTTINTPGLGSATYQADHLKETLREIDGKVVTYTVKVVNSGSDRGGLHSGPIAQRWGGVTEHAQIGLLREAAVYSAVSSGARYAFAEPGTGGEAFVPKYGDYGRSMSILNRAAGWYGAQVVPTVAGNGAGGVGRVEIILSGGDAATAAWLAIGRKAVKNLGGDVQFAMTGRKG